MQREKTPLSPNCPVTHWYEFSKWYLWVGMLMDHPPTHEHQPWGNQQGRDQVAGLTPLSMSPLWSRAPLSQADVCRADRW